MKCQFRKDISDSLSVYTAMIIRVRVLILLPFAQMTGNGLCLVNCNGEMILIEQGKFHTINGINHPNGFQI